MINDLNKSLPPNPVSYNLIYAVWKNYYLWARMHNYNRKKDIYMKYLHTMIRVSNLEESLDFFCNKLGLVQISRNDYESGKFSLIFLADPVNANEARDSKSPLLELTYNWPDENGAVEEYTTGRNFGHLAFRVDDIYKTCQDLVDKGVTINRPPRDGYMAFIKSPDGISIELLQKDQPLAPMEPWSSMKNIGSW